MSLPKCPRPSRSKTKNASCTFAGLTVAGQPVSQMSGGELPASQLDPLLKAVYDATQIRVQIIPPKPVRELRDLMRYRKTLVQERADEVNRLQKVLETANVKLASVATDVLGKSVTLDGNSYTIVGVMPDGFRFAGLDADVHEPERDLAHGLAELVV